MKGISTLLLTSVAFLCMQPVSAQTEIKISKLQWEQLADMNVARMGHRILPSGNDFVVIGGHTTGFAREQSAEIFKDAPLRWKTDERWSWAVMEEIGELMAV